MCYAACWPQHLKYRRNKRVIAAALAVCKLHAENEDGGKVGAVTSDWKVYDSDLDTCTPITDLEKNVLAQFRLLSVPERYSALRMSEEQEPIPPLNTV